MKAEIRWIALVMYWAALIGLVGPFLISAESDIAVIAGFALIGSSAYATYRFIRSFITRSKNDA